MKHPQFNAKMTHAVTDRIIRSWCGVSNAYLLSVEACQSQSEMLRAHGDEDSSASLCGPREYSGWYSTVAHDSLLYGMEMTLKSAQMIDGYHGYNKDLRIPGFIENFECNGLTYVYVRPTHRLDQIYRDETSDKMKQALERVVPVEKILKEVYRILYADMFGPPHWAPGSDYKPKAGNILHDSLRYTRHWMSSWLNPSTVQFIVSTFRRLNSILPSWFWDPELNLREA